MLLDTDIEVLSEIVQFGEENKNKLDEWFHFISTSHSGGQLHEAFHTWSATLLTRDIDGRSKRLVKPVMEYHPDDIASCACKKKKLHYHALIHYKGSDRDRRLFIKSMDKASKFESVWKKMKSPLHLVNVMTYILQRMEKTTPQKKGSDEKKVGRVTYTTHGHADQRPDMIYSPKKEVRVHLNELLGASDTYATDLETARHLMARVRAQRVNPNYKKKEEVRTRLDRAMQMSDMMYENMPIKYK